MSKAPDSAFSITETPIVAPSSCDAENAGETAGELPRSYGQPVLFVIARDPRTLFAYWDIDWQAVFQSEPPADKTAYFRLFNGNNIEEKTVPVEPFAGQAYIEVEESEATYVAELGYFQPAGVWKAVARSEAIATPVEQLAGAGEFQLASIPFHLGFQRLIELFRASKQDSVSLSALVARLQKKSVTADEEKPSFEGFREGPEILRAIESYVTAAAAPNTPPREMDASWWEQKLQELLGFSAGSSPHEGFSGSSR